jgi:spoIIIJ-associated protein
MSAVSHDVDFSAYAAPLEAVVAELDQILKVAELDLEPVARAWNEPHLEVELVGPDAAGTFGRSGKYLDALQYVANLVVVRRVGPGVRIIVDACGYREQRAATLTQLALEFAAQVKERQEECELDPLPPHERRIVHQAISDDPGIRTYSEGEEPDRRLIIAPR